MDRTRYDLAPTITILGCTLWTTIADEQASDVLEILTHHSPTTDSRVNDPRHRASRVSSGGFLQQAQESSKGAQARPYDARSRRRRLTTEISSSELCDGSNSKIETAEKRAGGQHARTFTHSTAYRYKWDTDKAQNNVQTPNSGFRGYIRSMAPCMTLKIEKNLINRAAARPATSPLVSSFPHRFHFSYRALPSSAI
jgi:hypothetical protein